MLLHDAVANTEAEAGSLADLLGGKERIENLNGIGNAGPVVGERNFHRVSRSAAEDLDSRWAADFVYAVVRVVENVQENLLELVSIAYDAGNAPVKAFNPFNAFPFDLVI